jgi:type II secretory pathway pseudopilin PulG
MKISQKTIGRKRKTLNGFTLIEALVLLFVFGVITTAFYQTWVLGTRHIEDAKNRLGAVALANQKMEIVRSLPYASIGTKHSNGAGGWLYGIPGGDILEDETVTVSNAVFHVHTLVQYVDDPFDGTLGGGPNDTIPADYKRARVEVSWGGGIDSQAVALFANFSPIGVEAASNTGVLSVNVLDSTGVGVSHATVHITNVASSIDLTDATDAIGNLTFPGAPAGVQNYHIVASKENYYSGQTYPRYPTTTFDPLDIDASVVINSVNQKSLVIDQSSDITISTVDPFDAAIPDIAFNLTGGRQLGTDHTTPSIKKYGLSEDTTTDADGTKSYADQSYGTYTYTSAASAVTYRFLHLTPEVATGSGLMQVLPGQNAEISAVYAVRSVNSLVVTVMKASDLTAFAGATVHMSNMATGGTFDATVTTDAFGQAYFPTVLPALVAGDYTLEVSATGFTTDTDTVAVTGAGLQEKTVNLSI